MGLAYPLAFPASYGSQVSAEINARSFGAKGDGVTDDTAALQAAFDAATASGRGLRLPEGNYLISAPITATGPFVVRGAGKELTTITRADNGVTATNVSGAGLSAGTYYGMVFGLNAGDVVQGAYAPCPVTVAGGASGTARFTWPAIAGATKYRLWIGTTRFQQASYFETTNLTIDITSTSGTAGSRPDWDTPIFRFTPHASKHSIIEDMRIKGDNYASHGILWEGDSSYKYTGFHARLWIEYFYESAVECRGNASFGRWIDVTTRTARNGVYLNTVTDHNFHNHEVGVCDYGINAISSVGNVFYGLRTYSNTLGGINLQAGADRNQFYGGDVNLNKQHGVILAGAQNLIVGMKFADNSGLTTNTYDDISVTGDRNVVDSCLFVPGSGGKLPRYNFGISGSVVLEVVNASINGTTYGTAIGQDYTKIVGLENIYQRIGLVTAVPVGVGVAISPTQAVVHIPYSPKRKIPTLTINGSFELRHNTTTAITGQSFTAGRDGATATITVASGLTVGQSVVLRCTNSSAYLEVNAI